MNVPECFVVFGSVDRIVVRTPTSNYHISTLILRGPVWLLLLILLLTFFRRFWLTPQLCIHIVSEKATINMAARTPQRVEAHRTLLDLEQYLKEISGECLENVHMKEQQVVTNFWRKYSLFQVYVSSLHSWWDPSVVGSLFVREKKYTPETGYIFSKFWNIWHYCSNRFLRRLVNKKWDSLAKDWDTTFLYYNVF